MSVFLIAEIGINHNGKMKLAKQLIDAAQEANFDAVKFQKRKIENVYAKEFLDSPRESPWGNTQRDQKKGLEFNLEDYKEIDDYCIKKNIGWFASAWDIESLEFLDQFNLKYQKIASPMNAKMPFVKEVAKRKIKTFISTGMSSLEEIDNVVEVFKNQNCPFELMHCNSSYPMQEENANLNVIKTLQDRYKCDVGYSGHETSLVKVCILATSLGATSIERHITLDRAMYGSDQAASIDVRGGTLVNFSEAIRKVEFIMGSKDKIIYESELEPRKKLKIISS